MTDIRIIDGGPGAMPQAARAAAASRWSLLHVSSTASIAIAIFAAAYFAAQFARVL